MAQKKVGVLIKEARTAAGLTQEQLARKVSGVSASDISRTERGEKDLTQAQLKLIAKATGVTQKSLLEAPQNLSAGKKTTSKTSSMKLTASEKKLVEYYRSASSDVKKAAVNMLKSNSGAGGAAELFTSLLGGLLPGREMPDRSLPLLADDNDFDFDEVVADDDE